MPSNTALPSTPPPWPASALAPTVVWVLAAVAVVLTWSYFRRFRVKRAPMGVLNLVDVLFIMVAIILLPYLYLALPRWLTGTIVAFSFGGLIYVTTEPLLRRRWAIWTAVVALCGAELWAAWRFGPGSQVYLTVNNAAVMVAVIGAVNLWAQSGMKARDAAFLAAFLVVYDVLATSLMPLTSELMDRLGSLPFTPMVAWRSGVGTGPSGFVAIGMGDLLMLALFPVVMRKAYGDHAGQAAAVVGLVAIGGISVAANFGLVTEMFALMALLGPVIVLQYVFWRLRLGPERRTWEFEAGLAPGPRPAGDQTAGR